MRDKLATIQKVLNVEKHPNADTLDIVTIQGWRCIAKIGEFKIGDLVVYCQIDSVLPELPEFEFLRKSCYVNNGVVKGFRLKTIRLRGEYSQGLILPLSLLEGKKFPNDARENPTYVWKENQDIDKLIGIVQFERPIPAYLQGKVKGLFPSFIPKTDETRVQVLANLLKQYEGTKCYITEKIDGTSVTYFIRDEEFGVCSRNLELAKDDPTFHENPQYGINANKKYQILHRDGTLVGEELDELPTPQPVSENLYWKMARVYDVENRLRQLGRKLAIQGEIYGEGVGKNPLKLRGQNLAIFSIYDITNIKYLGLEEMKEIISQLNGVKETGSIPVADSTGPTWGNGNGGKQTMAIDLAPSLLTLVPILDMEFTLISDIPKLVELAKGNSVITKSEKREGIVIRPLDTINDVRWSAECPGSRISFKVINQEYLVENDE